MEEQINKRQRNKDSLDSVIKRRNERLKNFFNEAITKEIGNVRIIGDENSPAIIFNDTYCLSCYVHNFDLRLNTNDRGEELAMVIKLNAETKYDHDEFLRWLYGADHRKVYKIMLSQTPNSLYLCGWNFTDKENKEGRYPVFSKFQPKVYFKENSCGEIASELIEQGYLVDIV